MEADGEDSLQELCRVDGGRAKGVGVCVPQRRFHTPKSTVAQIDISVLTPVISACPAASGHPGHRDVNAVAVSLWKALPGRHHDVRIHVM